MTAYACASAGYKVILLEADRIGLGGSGRATGLLSGEACDSYRALESQAGKRAARAMFDAMQTAPRDLAATVKRPASAPVSILPINFAWFCPANPTS
jgi:glycine/D-amino acid oxidase-like deaminating enzyme